MKNYISISLIVYVICLCCGTKNNNINNAEPISLEADTTLNKATDKNNEKRKALLRRARRIDIDTTQINSDTLTFTHFKRLVDLRGYIHSAYIKKFTSVRTDTIRGYYVYTSENYDLLILQKSLFYDGKFIFLVYNKQGNETDKLVVQTSKKIANGFSFFSDVSLSKIFSNEHTLVVEHFEATNQPVMKPDDKKNLRKEFYNIKDGKWIKP